MNDLDKNLVLGLFASFSPFVRRVAVYNAKCQADDYRNSVVRIPESGMRPNPARFVDIKLRIEARNERS